MLRSSFGNGWRVLTAHALTVTLACAVILATGTVRAGVAEAAGPSPVVHFHSPATVRANGAGAVITLTVTCPGPQAQYLEIGVQQLRHGQPLASASGYAQLVNCGNTPQTVTEPLCTGCSGVDADFGGGEPLRTGPATAMAFFLDCSVPGCEGRYLPSQSVTLVDDASLDHMRSPTATLSPHAALVAGGAAADVFLTVTCRDGRPQLPHPGELGIGLWQRIGDRFVQDAVPALDPVGHCQSGLAHFHVRLYPGYAALNTGAAFVVWESLWGPVILR